MGIKSFEAFSAGRETVTKDRAWCDEWFPGGDQQEVIEYSDGMFIIALGEGFYLLIIGNAQWHSEDLEHLERVLYAQWYLPEIVGLGREKLEFALQIEQTRRQFLLNAATIHGDAILFEGTVADKGMADLVQDLCCEYGGDTGLQMEDTAEHSPLKTSERRIERIASILALTAC